MLLSLVPSAETLFLTCLGPNTYSSCCGAGGLVTKSCPATPWTVAHQAPLSVGFYRQILGWVDISFSRGSSWLRDWTLVSCIAGRFFTVWAIGKSLYIYIFCYLIGFVLLLHVSAFSKFTTKRIYYSCNQKILKHIEKKTKFPSKICTYHIDFKTNNKKPLGLM